jgi:hypothetical protein
MYLPLQGIRSLAANARPELRLEAGARHERTLEAVSSRPLFGLPQASASPRPA